MSASLSLHPAEANLILVKIWALTLYRKWKKLPMQSIIEFPVTLILSYFVVSKFVEVCYINFLFHENVTHLLPGVSLFILPSPLHIFSIRSDSSLDSAYFSFCSVLNWIVPVPISCLLCYSFYNSPCYSLGPTSNSTTDVTNFLLCPEPDSVYIKNSLLVSTNLTKDSQWSLASSMHLDFSS